MERLGKDTDQTELSVYTLTPIKSKDKVLRTVEVTIQKQKGDVSGNTLLSITIQ